MIKKSMAAALAVFGLSGLVQAQDAQRGEDLSVTCAACHGADGNSTDAVNPKIAGQNERYLVEQLLAFKNGDRINALMNSMVADLSEEDIRDLAVFYAEQEGNFGEADPDLLALGEQIYRAGNQDSGVMACMACHGPTGAGNAPA
ncbi:MAG: cytochrome c, partial [Natronospirillum sp.]